MATVRQIITDWQTPAGAGMVTVMHFNADSSVAGQRDALGDFWGSMDGWLTNLTLWNVRQEGSEFDEATGTLTGAWTDGPIYSGAGELTDSVVPDATQVLVRWRTNSIRNGRFVQGRTFVPGLARQAVIGGNLGPTPRSNMNDWIGTFLDTLQGFGVWHRPKNGGSGEHIIATDGSPWAELAVLRRRRK